MQFPPIIFGQLLSIEKFSRSSVLANIYAALHPGAYTYNVIYIILIILFSYFWTTVQFQPKEMAKNLRNSGSFIPGLRPGHRTAEYLEMVMARITFYGAAFLAIIAVVPTVIAQMPGLDIDWQVASFSLDVVQRVEANLIMRNYEGFSSTGRIKGARGW
jgi:preprotein translocase subunit SecY